MATCAPKSNTANVHSATDKVNPDHNTELEAVGEINDEDEPNIQIIETSKTTAIIQDEVTPKKRKRHSELTSGVLEANNKRPKIQGERYSTRSQTNKKRRQEANLPGEIRDDASNKKRKIEKADKTSRISKRGFPKIKKSRSAKEIQDNISDSNDERYQLDDIDNSLDRKAQLRDAKIDFPISKTGKKEAPLLGSFKSTSLNTAVAAQVDLVRDFAKTFRPENSTLERIISDKNFITVPESALLAAILCMYIRYEIPIVKEPSISDVKSIILDRHFTPMGSMSRVDFVTIDTSRECHFLDRIREKIVGSGLENFNLLELQLEILKREQLKMAQLDKSWHAIQDEDNKREGDQILSAVAQVWDDIGSESQHDNAVDATAELSPWRECENRRRGVCPPPMMQI